MPLNKSTVREHLTSGDNGKGNGFTKINTHQCFDDFAAIGAFLSGPDTVKPHLRTLEEHLNTRLRERFTTFLGGIYQGPQEPVAEARQYFADATKRATGTSAPDPHFSHLLTDELSAREEQHGFTLDKAGWFSEPKAQMYIGNLSPTAFLEQLHGQRHWKDPGAGQNHGEFSHRLQWYLISIAQIVSKPAAVFGAISKFYEPDPQGRFPMKALWDALCDRGPAGTTSPPNQFETSEPTDFRSPDNLNLWLIKFGVTDYPLLASFLSSRYTKRANYNVMDYLTAKIYGKTLGKKLYTDLQKNSKEQQHIDTLLERAMRERDLILRVWCGCYCPV